MPDKRREALYRAMKKGYSRYIQAGMYGEMNLMSFMLDEIEPVILQRERSLLERVRKPLEEMKEQYKDYGYLRWDARLNDEYCGTSDIAAAVDEALAIINEELGGSDGKR